MTTTTTARPTTAGGRAPARPAARSQSGALDAPGGTGTETAAIVRWIQRVPTAKVLVSLVAVLCGFGLVMVGSASSVISMTDYGSPFSDLIRETMWLAIGAVAMFAASRIDYRLWRRIRVPLMIVTVVLLVAVLVPGVGQASQGSSRWIGFGFLKIQPSELMKLALAVFAADLVARRVEKRAKFKHVVVPLGLVAGLSMLLVIKQPDMGTALVLGAITFALLFASGIPLGPVVKVLFGLAGVAMIFALSSSYRRARIFSFLNPQAHQSGSGYQVLQSLIGLGSGHLTGLGLGNSREKWGLLPNAHTDFIFSIVGEELGLIGAVAVLLLLGALAWFGLRAANRAPDRFGTLLGVALVAWIGTETVINVGAAIGLLPVTGIPLPFISYGGSSLVITMVAAGILVNIARQERVPVARHKANRRLVAVR